MELTDYTFDTRIRRRHIPLLSHQRRLRHLNAVLARNITSTEIAEDDNFGLLYTIHLQKNDGAIYTSETSEGNLNPNWQQLQLSKFNSLRSNSSTSFVVRVWVARKGVTTCFIEWDVNLQGLSFLGEQVPKDGRKFLPNTLLFSMPEGIYGPADCVVKSPKTDHPGHSGFEVLYSDPSIVRNSCTVNTLRRMMTTERAIKQTQVSVSRVRRAIEKKLQQRVRLHRSRAREENLRLRISLLEQEIAERQSKLEQEKLACQAATKEVEDRGKELENIASELVEKRNTLVEQRRQYFQVRENLLKANSMLALRQKELISELAFIYPIAQFPDKKGYSICFVHLPNSEDFSDRDDPMISVALGYVTHVLLMMSHFLDVPLRYPLIHYGTNSSVRDNLVEHFSDKEREFPLYLKGKEKMLFNYSVYLLNRNIAQLRCNCNLTTKDLRFTLHNLYGLFEHYSIRANGGGQVNSPAILPASSLSVPVPIQNNNNHHRDARDNLPSSDEVLSPPVQPPNIEGSFPSGTSQGADSELATSPKLSSSLDEGLDQLQVSSAEMKARQMLTPKFQSLQVSQHSSEPNLREFEARNALRVRQGGASIEECLLPVPPVVYDATEESASLHSGDGVEVEVAVDTLFDADLTARTEVLANIVRSFQTYAAAPPPNVPNAKQ
ncbi:unnamed protein product [Ixodes hexagonus]